MIDVALFYRALCDAGVSFFTGVPDSLLADLGAYIQANTPPSRHLIAANEGGAVAAAAGHYLATGQPAVVYLQNSGQGNLVNPLCSLLCPEVQGIPVLLLVGWRGDPGQADEPQHRLQGRITLPLFHVLGVPAEVLPMDDSAAISCVRRLLDKARADRTPVAAVISRQSFKPLPRPQRQDEEMTLTRERAIEVTVGLLPTDALVVCTTGMASRELYEIRERTGRDSVRDCLIIGAMGHASQIALALALSRPEREVVCLDGDGAAIMHMGSFAVAGTSSAANFKHVLLNNGAHDSVGGQPTAGQRIDFPALACACCYGWAQRVADERELIRGVRELLAQPGPAFLEARVRCGARANLGRPRMSPAEHVTAFRHYLS